MTVTTKIGKYTMIGWRYFFLSAIYCLLVPVAYTQQPAGLPPGLDQYINTVLSTFEVPGMSIAVVQNGQVVLARGYGQKKLGYPSPVDAHTLFPIASNTKLFTATALAILEEEGKLKWDDPVSDHLPWFRMSDPWVSSQVSIRDILVHHSGIPAYAGDLMIFPPSTYTRKEIVSKLRLVPLVHGFRTTYAYDNILYLAAGEVIKAAAGMEWEDFIQTRILDKLGMSETVSRFSNFKAQVNISAAHARLHGKVKVDDQFPEQAIGDAGNPAGGIASNAIDMCKWLITQLDSGVGPNKVRIFKPAATSQLWKMVTPIPISPAPASLKPAQMDFWGYALGVRTYNYGAYKIVGHGGKLDGFVSQVVLVPKLNLGIAVLTNQESTGAYWSVIYHLLDYYMGNKPFNWIAGYKMQMDSALATSARDRQKAIIKPMASEPILLSPEKITGTYSDKLYGDVIITNDSAGLLMRFSHTPQLIADLSYFQYDTFMARFRNGDLKADAYATFSLNPDGTVAGVKLKIIDPDSDLDFDDLQLKKKSPDFRD